MSEFERASILTEGEAFDRRRELRGGMIGVEASSISADRAEFKRRKGLGNEIDEPEGASTSCGYVLGAIGRFESASMSTAGAGSKRCRAL